MTDRVFDGPDCGIDGCEREQGHIGDHRRVEEITPRSLRADRIERAARELLRMAAIQPGGHRFGWPTWQVDDASIARLQAALSDQQVTSK